MNDLEVCRNAGPPATIEDLTKFLLIAPEKATALRAEIRAIKKAGLAAEVYEQKMQEQRILAEMILDASVLMGDMARELRKGSGGDRRSENFKRDSTVPFEKSAELRDSAAPKLESKEKTMQDLGFSKKQVQRFETLAANKDLVEQEKAQAREEGRMPTRTRVIDLAQKRKEHFKQDMAQIDDDYEVIKEFHTAIHSPLKLPVSNTEVVSALMRAAHSLSDLFTHDLDTLDEAIQKLQGIQILLKKEAHQRGKTSNHQPGGAGGNQAATSQSGRVDQIGAD